MALSADTLDNAIRPDMRDAWSIEKKKWFPREDTQENIAYDKRTPGELFSFLVHNSSYRENIILILILALMYLHC